jgi:hypothetical protein
MNHAGGQVVGEPGALGGGEAVWGGALARR